MKSKKTVDGYGPMTFIPNPNGKYCEGCYYWKPMHRNPKSSRCCHYILVEEEPRGCEAGKNCDERLELTEEEAAAKDLKYRNDRFKWSDL